MANCHTFFCAIVAGGVTRGTVPLATFSGLGPGGQSLWRHFLVWDQGDSPSGPIYLFTEAGQGVIMKAPRKLRKKDLADERKESS